MAFPTSVFNSVPLLELHNAPLVFVSFMTFTLILSSVTMVRAVQEGFQRNQMGVVKWLIPTIIGGLIFLGSQYLEWSHLIHNGMTLTSPWQGEVNGVPLTATVNFGAFVFCNYRFSWSACYRRNYFEYLVIS